jgi:hypothetical protein
MSLDIRPEIENVVRERARTEGVSVDDLLERTFASKIPVIPPPSDPKARVHALLTQWQAADNTPRLPPIPTRPGETPTQALFRKWDEEAANMTDEECEQEAKFWEEFKQSIDAERIRAGMRTIF